MCLKGYAPAVNSHRKRGNALIAEISRSHLSIGVATWAAYPEFHAIRGMLRPLRPSFPPAEHKIPARVEEEGLSILPFGYGEDGWNACRRVLVQTELAS